MKNITLSNKVFMQNMSNKLNFRELAEKEEHENNKRDNLDEITNKYFEEIKRKYEIMDSQNKSTTYHIDEGEPFISKTPKNIIIDEKLKSPLEYPKKEKQKPLTRPPSTKIYNRIFSANRRFHPYFDSNTLKRPERINSSDTRKALNNQKSLENLIIGPLLGRGSYATVKLGTDSETKEKFAVKTYLKTKLFDPAKKKNVEREIMILNNLSHENIIRLYKIIEDNTSINLVMEFIGTMSLQRFMKKRNKKPLNKLDFKYIVNQIISALQYCHSKNVVHRDLKMDNILLNKERFVKIIDFGFSICVTTNQKLKVFCGTPSYMAPEIVRRKEYYGKPVDIWAMGILFYFLCCGSFPFSGKDESDLYNKISKGVFSLPQDIGANTRLFIIKILKINPSERPSCNEVLYYLFSL